MTHHHTHRFTRITLALAAAGVLLSACGGGGGGQAINGNGNNGNACTRGQRVAGTDVPLSATASAGGAFAFVKCVVTNKDETPEPLTTGDAMLGTSDTDDPDPNV